MTGWNPTKKSPTRSLVARRIFFFLDEVGVNPIKTLRFARALPWLFRDYIAFIRRTRSAQYHKDWKTIHWSLFAQDKYSESGSQNSLYFLQDLECSQYVVSKGYQNHIDIGSRVDGFLAQIATTRKVTALDIRDSTRKIKNIHFKKGDILDIDCALERRFDLTTSLHALEHVGLGRYGDKIDPDGMFKALTNCRRLTMTGGETLIALPVIDGEKNIIEFNAQRLIASKNYIEHMRHFFGSDQLAWWMCIDENRNPISGCELSKFESALHSFRGLGIVATSWVKSGDS